MSEFTYTQRAVDRLNARIAELEAQSAGKPPTSASPDAEIRAQVSEAERDRLKKRVVELEAEVAGLKAHLSPSPEFAPRTEPDDKKKPEPEVLHQRQRSR